MKILLHICCGPCASLPIERLKEREFEIIGFFYNPNIYPQEEYNLRRANCDIVLKRYNIETIPSDYEEGEWQKAIKGYEYEKEGGRRCEVCIKLRLKKTGEMAKENGFDMFGTTLSVGINKDSKLINLYGANVSDCLNIPFYAEDFKKNAGFQRSVALSKEMGLYRQKYCGCLYSLREKTNLKKNNIAQVA